MWFHKSRRFRLRYHSCPTLPAVLQLPVFTCPSKSSDGGVPYVLVHGDNKFNCYSRWSKLHTMSSTGGIQIPSRLPLLCTHDGVLLPGSTVRISVDTARNMQLVKSRLLKGTSLKSTIIGVIPNTRDPEEDSDELPSLHRWVSDVRDRQTSCKTTVWHNCHWLSFETDSVMSCSSVYIQKSILLKS